MNNTFVALSSTFYKLEKSFADGLGYSVYEFHTVAGNGNMYIKHCEEDINHNWRTNYGDIQKLGKGEAAKTFGNAEYKKLKSKGFKFAGVYKMDIFGQKSLISGVGN